MDLDTEDLRSGVIFVYYILLARHINRDGLQDDDALLLYYVSGLAVRETAEGYFSRLGYFRWDVCEPADTEYYFGSRKVIRLV